MNRELIRMIRDQFALDAQGVHGVPHWRRVHQNGLRLARLTGARRQVVELFAVLHDSQRLNDDHDPHHGHRAAEFARALSGSVFEIEPDDLELLVAACRGHSEGRTTGDITVLTCWDADRLDLGRIGVRPSSRRLCTDAAKDSGMLKWAIRRSRISRS